MGISIKSRFLLIALPVTIIATLGRIAWPQNISDQHSQWSAVASMKIEGKLLKIEGPYYVIKDDQGKEIYLLVTQDTDLSGSYKSGDRIEAWTSPIEHSIAIRAVNLNRDDLAIDSATYTHKGKLVKIEGRYYVLVGADGKKKRFLVDHDTELAGEFRPGDQVEILSSPLGHAVGIRAAKEPARTSP